jgi:alpha-D-ribose 1-methylphosphonate 5-triphosphate synthase subunit PhnH
MTSPTDIELLNRNNFRNCLEAISRPGSSYQIQAFFGSTMMAMAVMLLYSEVCFYQKTTGDWKMLKALTGACEENINQADYLFLDTPHIDTLMESKCGNQQNPDYSATLIYASKHHVNGTRVVLSGPGIDGSSKTTLPTSSGFLQKLREKNRHFPQGVDVFFLTADNHICAVPRTTRVKIL